jgi:hypothetical protein
MKLISPEQLRELRKKIGLTSKSAADSVYINHRLWQRYEAPVTAKSSLPIKAATLELFCLKHGLPYPPNPQGKLSKLVSFYGGQGGAGHTLLTIDICTLLMLEGFEVLIVTGKHGASIYQNRATDLNLPFPRVKEIDEFPSSKANSVIDTFSLMESGGDKVKSILKNYDFVFLDIAVGAAPSYFNDLEPDLIIGPANMDDIQIRQLQAYNSLIDLRRRFNKSGNSHSKLALLMVNVPTHYTFSLSYYGLTDPDDKEQRELSKWFNKQKEQQMEEQSELFEQFNSLRKVGIYLMYSYTSNAYKSYSHDYERGFSIFNKEPNSLPSHELRGVKSEMLRLLGVPDKTTI